MNVQDLCMFRSISGGGGSGAGIDDNTVSSTSTWSSLKISEELAKEHAVPTKVGDHLYEITYGNWNEADALTYFNGKYPPFNGGCTAVRKENKIGRNFDWHYDDIAEFIINCKAHDDIHASIGIVGNVTTITDEEAASGVWKDDYIILPYRTVDGINDAGVFIEVNVVDSHDNGHTTGTNPDSDHELFTTMVVRYVLDHATSAHNAVELLQACNIRTTSAEEEYHWMISDKVYNLEVEIVDNEIKVTQLADYVRFPVVTNFFRYGWNSVAATATYNTSLWNPDATTLNEHAVGVRRYNTALGVLIQNPDSTIEDIMEAVKYSQYYEIDDAYDEFNGIYPNGTDLTIYSEAEDYADIISAAQEAYARHERDGSTWITCHTAIYDLDAKSLKVATQEDYDTWFVRNVAFDGTQPDWNQNDTNAADYIKNRIAYDNTKYAVFKSTLTSSGTLNSGDATRDYNFESLFAAGNTAQLIVGDVVFPKTKIKMTKYGSYLMFGNDSARGGEDTDESYAVYYNSPGTPPSMGLQPISGKDTSWIVDGAEVTITVEQEDIHKIDSKYLYNADWQQNNATSADYVKNRPGAYTTVEMIQGLTSVCTDASTESNPTINVMSSNVKSDNFDSLFVEGNTIQLIVGQKIFPETNIKTSTSGYLMAGNDVVRGGTDTEEQYAIYYNAVGVVTSFQIQSVTSKDTSWVVDESDITILIKKTTDYKIPAKYTVTPDWNQNTETGDGFIANKPGMYTTGTIGKLTATCEQPSTSSVNIVNYNTSIDSNFDALWKPGTKARLRVGNVYFPENHVKVVHGSSGSEIIVLGNAKDRYGPQFGGDAEDSGENYACFYYSMGTPDSFQVCVVDGKDSSWVVEGEPIELILDDKVHYKVPSVYIPTADWEQNNQTWDGYISNKPGMYEEDEVSTCISTCISPSYSNVKFNTGTAQASSDFASSFIADKTARLIVGNTLVGQSIIKYYNGNYMFGNTKYFNGADTGEPYCIYFASSSKPINSLICAAINGKDWSWCVPGEKITIEIVKNKIVHYVPDKYLASNTPTAGQVLTSDGSGGKTWTNLTSLNGAVKITTNTTTGVYPSLSVAEGGPDITGSASASIGNGNTISSPCSIAVGAGNTVSGTDSIAVGGGCRATGNFSTAIGSGVRADAVGSIAFGQSSEAKAAYSIAAGRLATTNGEHSAAIGNYVVASGDDQFVVGKYNIEDDDDEYAVIVGNGSTSSRSNALTVDWSGNVESAGDLTIHYGGQEIDVGQAITSGGGGGVSDVKVDGVSVVTNGVANIDLTDIEDTVTAQSADIEALKVAVDLRKRDYSSMAQIAGIVRGNSVEINSKIFPVGDQIVMPWKDMDDNNHNTDETAYQVEWDIVRHGIVTLQDGSQVPGMFLQMHKCSAYGVQFSHRQAFFQAFSEALPAGTYNVSFGVKYNATFTEDTTGQFTLTQSLPVGGKLFLNGNKVEAWASATATEAIESVALTVGAGGTSLGSIASNNERSSDDLNSMNRIKYGHNRWSTSAIRQYLNSADVNWFSSKEDFDIKPDEYTKHGFMAGFNSDFLNAIKPVKMTTALNTVEGYTETTEDTFDTFFLPSLQQMNVEPQLANVEGDAFDYWKLALGSQNFVKAGSSNIFDAFKIPAINNNSAQNVRLRSAGRAYVYQTQTVNLSGYVINGSADYANRFSPVCVIC